MTAKQIIDFILESVLASNGSEIFVSKSKAYRLLDLRDALKELMPKFQEEIIPIRPGEKMHEILINGEEMKYVWELENKFIVFPLITKHLFYPTRSEEDIKQLYPNIKKVKGLEHYSSDKVERITKDELKSMIQELNLL